LDELDLNFRHALSRFFQFKELDVNGIFQVIEVSGSLEVILEFSMNLPKQIYLNQVKIIIHLLLYLFHLLIVFALRSVFLVVEVGKVEREVFLKKDEGNLLIALD
jgi:hypothetical protein